MPALLSYGLRLSDGRIISVHETHRGKICACICPRCKDSLIARQGEKNDWHFAHASGKECQWAPETALHLLCKQIIAEHRYMRLAFGRRFQYTAAQKEKPFHNMRADVWIASPQEDWIVEVFVTNEVTPRKETLIRNLNKSAIEIDVSQVPRDISVEALQNLLLDGWEGKRVLHQKEEPEIRSLQWFNPFEVLLYIGALIVLAYTFYQWCFRPKRKRSAFR